MCGRYGLTVDAEALAAAFGVPAEGVEHPPRYNIAPTQNAPVILREGADRKIAVQRWGMLSAGIRAPRKSSPLINARAETVSTRPAFREAWRKGNRCVVPATGFFEWGEPEGYGGPKIPNWIQMSDGRPFGFAGLWERSGPTGDLVESYAILTTEPNDLVRTIHDRMPVILGDAFACETWLDPRVPPGQLAKLLAPFPATDMRAHRVGTYVNDPRNEGPRCIEPAA